MVNDVLQLKLPRAMLAAPVTLTASLALVCSLCCVSIATT